MSNITQSTHTPPITLSKNAQDRIIFLASKPNSTGAMLRIAVDGGGCSGFKYSFSFEPKANDDDNIITQGGATVLIDNISLDFIKGSELDFINELGGSFFSVKNPNTTASCGCGNSFSV